MTALGLREALPRRSEGIPIGFSKFDAQELRYKGPGHLITIAPSRSGKGRDVLVPACLDFAGSMIIVDPKAELASITSAYRRKLGRVFYLDPFGLVRAFLPNAELSSYNPLDLITPDNIEAVAEAQKLATALVWQSTDGDNFFNDGAGGLVTGAAYGLARHASPEDRNLIALRSIITGAFKGGIAPHEFARAVMENSGDEFLKQLVGRYSVKPEGKSSITDVIATADIQTRFLSDPAIARCLKRSDFRFADLKNEVVTVYVILPMKYLFEHGKYFRLIVASAISELMTGPRGAVPVLVMMDEFFQLGPLKTIENSMSMAAGYGVQLWPVLQDLNQLNIYPKTWETFIAGAAVRMYFAPHEITKPPPT